MLYDQLQFRKIVVRPKQIDFEIGDFVKPETIMGLHFETGQPVKAGLNGRIVTIFHNPNKGSVTMLVVSGDE
jgi:hypothetical protein